MNTSVIPLEKWHQHVFPLPGPGKHRARENFLRKIPLYSGRLSAEFLPCRDVRASEAA